MYFSVNVKKQEKPKVFEKPRTNPRPSEKTPRLDRKTQDLGIKPKEWHRYRGKQVAYMVPTNHLRRLIDHR